MSEINNLQDISLLQANTPLNTWLSYLENSHFKPIDLGLERIYRVAKDLDLLNPAPFVITVAGTNGKGTTCRLLETILLNIGLKVGVYSSPHLIRYNERVRIQNKELADAMHTESFAFIQKNKKESLTYFEFSTLSALYLFKQAQLDVVILEVGLGGRLDATNIIDNNIAIITSIDIDHTDFLGSTREAIAFEKAGIFRRDNPAIIGEPNIPKTMLEQANKLHSKLACRDKDWSFHSQENSWSWKNANKLLADLPIPQIPLANAATVLATLDYLPFTISENVIRQSLQEVELLGRFQYLKQEKRVKLAEIISKPVEQLAQVIVDVGHNPHAARYLSEKLTALKADKLKGRIIAVCGILKDKDSQGIFEPLLPVIDYWYCVTLEGIRGQSGEELLATLQQIAKSQQLIIQGESNHLIVDTLNKALTIATKDDVIVVFGSFHTVGPLLEALSY